MENTIDLQVVNTMTQDTTHEGDNNAVNEANGEVNIVHRKTNNVVNGAIRHQICSLYDKGNNIYIIYWPNHRCEANHCAHDSQAMCK